jgi:hypothetical protein
MDEIILRTEGKNLILNGKFIKEFPVKIEDAIMFDDRIIVLLDAISYQYNRNVFCIDIDGNSLWQIPELKLQGVFDDKGSPYTRIVKISNVIFSAINWSGDAFHLDTNSGKIIKHKWSK